MGGGEGMQFLRLLEDLMSTKTALLWDCSFAFWWGRRRRHGGSHSPGFGAESTPPWPPICALLLSLGLWLLIWGVLVLATDGFR
jgi:hypothetical protein